MQIFNLDISHQGIPPLLSVKQGDVGRKFKVILTDGGMAYAVPEGAMFSVWYNGSSGEGNYSAIGARTAVTVDGSEATVEVIAQMVKNPGGGSLCLVLSASDGSQLGLWNITYIVEAVPGMGSAAAEQYYTAFSVSTEALAFAAKTFVPDKTLSKEGAPADAAKTGNQLSLLKNEVSAERSERKAEIAVERARLDQLAKIKEGSTTGDAELIDARTGHDGVIYGNAGSAVRSQVGAIEEVFDSIRVGNILNPHNSESGSFSESDTNLAVGKELVTMDHSGRVRTVNPIPIVCGTEYLYIRTSMEEETTQSAIHIYFLDEQKGYISKNGNGVYFTAVINAGSCSTEVPDACSYIHVVVGGVSSGHDFSKVCISCEPLDAFELFTNKKIRTLKDSVLPKKVAPTCGKKMLVFGDSITETANMNDDGTNYNPGYRLNWPVYVQQMLQADSLKNYAKSGATCRDTGYQWVRFNKTTGEVMLKPEPTYYNEKDSEEWPRSVWSWCYKWYSTQEKLEAAISDAKANEDPRYEDDADGNLEWRWVKKNDNVLYRMNLSEQVDLAVSDENNSIPDIIIISIGTNDSDAITNRPDDSRDTYQDAMKISALESFNYNDRAKMHGALRYAMGTLRDKYPDARCFIATPLQRAAFEIPQYTRDAIVAIGNRYNFKVIDAYSESGIVRETCEPRYLPDGLHPSSEKGISVEGIMKQASLYASVILSTYLYDEYN